MEGIAAQRRAGLSGEKSSEGDPASVGRPHRSSEDILEHLI